jgi:predicted transcriptional regulator
MAKITIRSTFSLDPETVAALGRLAEKWGVSKSAALRRIIDAAAVVEGVDAASDSMAALKELQERLALTPEQVEAWVQEVRAMREGRSP